MKTNLEPQRVLSWSLLGLKPMQRALLRRTAEQLAFPINESSEKRCELTWCSFDTNQSVSDCFAQPGILIIDCDALAERMQNQSGEESNLGLLYQRSNGQIRLLWNWCNRGKESLMWCTELCFDGVIYDLASMNRWVRICLSRGKVSQGQHNVLLRDLRLPAIAPRTSPLV